MAKGKNYSGLSRITAKGTKAPIYRSNGATSVGVKDPNTGLIFKHPRGQIDNGLVSSKSVKVTNPKALPAAQTRERNKTGRTTLGQGGV